MVQNSSVDLLRRATGLDKGESEAIIYTDENKAELLLMNEAMSNTGKRNGGTNTNLSVLFAAMKKGFRK